jgi:galactan 5-O-arabinofuranosyltransferase
MCRRGGIWWYVIGVPAGWIVCWAIIGIGGIPTNAKRWDLPVTGVAVILAVAGALILWWVAHRAQTIAVRLLMIATSVFSSAVATLGLHGTRWTFNGLYSDSGFRTQAVTRYAASPALGDYGYQGLPAYYPPGLPWVEGRLADLVHQPAWTVMKPVTLVLAALVPLLTYALWRRIVPGLPAALVTSAATLFTAQLVKPDEWMVVSLLVPWWLDTVRGLVRRGHQWPFWAHGLILGGLLWVHLYYFFPMAVATVLALGLDLVRHRSSPLRPKRALLIGGIGLLVAAPYWVPVLWLRLTGPPTDNLQLRWSPPDYYTYHALDPAMILGEIGLAWLILRARRNRHAEGLLLALAAALLVFAGGAGLERFGVALLVEKSESLVTALGVIAGVLAIYDIFTWARHRGTARPDGLLRHRRITAGGLVVAVLVAAVAVRDYVAEWTSHRPAIIAHQTRYPSGEYPAHAGKKWHLSQPWGTETGPSVEHVRSAWHEVSRRSAAQDADTVLVTTRVDLVATTPFHTFTAWKSIYSHPNAQFAARIALLRRVSRCSTPACAANLLRHNRFDRVDGLVLRRASNGDLVYPVATDNFPDGWRRVNLRFSSRLFGGSEFSRRDIGNVAVIAVKPKG